MADQKQAEKITNGPGFIAALDQSGGSTPKALKLYGVEEDAYSSEEEMYDLIHAMRSRIAQAPEFTGAKVIGAILFEKTMNREIGGKPAGQYLWEDSGVVPFLKVDKGLEDAQDGVKLMKPIDGLDDLLKRAVEAQMFGTKMRSVIDAASRSGIAANVAQQFEIGKLTLPESANQYKPLVDHDRVMRVVALSGGYSRDEANARLAKNAGVIASFSRALTEGLSAAQDDAAFRKQLGATIDSIYNASVAG